MFEVITPNSSFEKFCHGKFLWYYWANFLTITSPNATRLFLVTWNLLIKHWYRGICKFKKFFIINVDLSQTAIHFFIIPVFLKLFWYFEMTELYSTAVACLKYIVWFVKCITRLLEGCVHYIFASLFCMFFFRFESFSFLR